jgi:hypothetical protein
VQLYLAGCQSLGWSKNDIRIGPMVFTKECSTSSTLWLEPKREQTESRRDKRTRHQRCTLVPLVGAPRSIPSLRDAHFASRFLGRARDLQMIDDRATSGKLTVDPHRGPKSTVDPHRGPKAPWTRTVDPKAPWTRTVDPKEHRRPAPSTK